MSALLQHRNGTLASAGIRDRARELIAQLRQRAGETEQLRRLPAVNVEALRRAGLFQLVQARRSGGQELSLRTQIDVVADIARGCASTAWCLGVVHAHSWLLASFPQRAQDDAYGTNPDALVSAVITARGKASTVRGGWLLSGFWPFCSGCQHSDWVILGAALANEKGETVDEGVFLVSTSEVEIKDDWHVTALRGTGSCSVAVNHLFVPEHRYLSFADLLRGQAPGRDLHDGFLYRAPAGPVLMLVLAPAALGAAEGALETFTERLPGRKVAYTHNELQSEMPITHLQIGEAATKVAVARLLLYRCADDIQEVSESGRPVDPATRARFHLDCAYAIRQCLEATETLLLACGGSGISETNSIQRAARDLHAMSMHGAFNLPLNLETYGRTLVGLKPKTLML